MEARVKSANFLTKEKFFILHAAKAIRQHILFLFINNIMIINIL
jgi:hypothetical protein